MTHIYQTIDGFSEYDEQGLFLNHLLTLSPQNNLKVAEIGVYKGRMTAMWCIELYKKFGLDFEYFAIDHFKGSAEHDHTVDYYMETVNNLKPLDVNYTIIKGNSSNASEQFEDNSLDIVYIDASHDFVSVSSDISHWLPKVKSGGILCGDDYIHGWDEVVKAVNLYFGKENVKRFGKQQWYIIKK